MQRETGSKLLMPYKSVGLVAEDVPFCVNQLGMGYFCSFMGLGNETFITVSLGRSFQIYKCDKLTPVVISPQMHAPIRYLSLPVVHRRCMAAQREVTFVGIGNHILIWKRVTLVCFLCWNSSPGRYTHIGGGRGQLHPRPGPVPHLYRYGGPHQRVSYKYPRIAEEDLVG